MYVMRFVKDIMKAAAAAAAVVMAVVRKWARARTRASEHDDDLHANGARI
jgi:hypothetical protein